MKVKVIDNISRLGSKCKCWYKPGQIYDVVDYRHNHREYWELEGWNGHTTYQWILKEHTIPYNDEYKIEIDKDLFTL